MSAETIVARVLLFGGVVAVALMLAGLVDLELHAKRTGQAVDAARVVENREAARPVDVFVSLPQLVRALRHWPPEPVAIMTTGMIVLLLTPAAGVAAACAGFLAERDQTYAVVSAALILALAFGFALGLGD